MWDICMCKSVSEKMCMKAHNNKQRQAETRRQKTQSYKEFAGVKTFLQLIDVGH